MTDLEKAVVEWALEWRRRDIASDEAAIKADGSFVSAYDSYLDAAAHLRIAASALENERLSVGIAT